MVVSIDARNNHERASTVLVVPLSTTPPKLPSHLELSPGETGLSENSTIQAESITTVRKTSLHEPKDKLRRLSERVIEQTARRVVLAMGFPDLKR
jgi:mRNA-degrading endonuclease toxin of MazEF toxin-antitoxin module